MILTGCSSVDVGTSRVVRGHFSARSNTHASTLKLLKFSILVHFWDTYPFLEYFHLISEALYYVPINISSINSLFAWIWMPMAWQNDTKHDKRDRVHLIKGDQCVAPQSPQRVVTSSRQTPFSKCVSHPCRGNRHGEASSRSTRSNVKYVRFIVKLWSYSRSYWLGNTGNRLYIDTIGNNFDGHCTIFSS